MSLYALDGTPIISCYDYNSLPLIQVYDINGNRILINNSIKVANYNVGQWYLGNHNNVPANRDAEYYALQNGIIQSIDADILLLEEYVDQFSKSGRTAYSLLSQYYPYIEARGGGSTTTTDGRCICSKFPISNYAVRVYQQGGKYYDSCNVTIGNLVFTVFVTHLHWASGLPDYDREAQVAELISVASQMQNVIIGGDFNTAIGGSATEEQNTERYNTFVKPFVDAGFNSANFSKFGNFVTCIDGPTVASSNWYLDNIYTSQNIEIVDAYVDTTKLTDGLSDKIDHMPLIATLQIGG